MCRSWIPVCLRNLRALCGLVAWPDSGMHPPVPCLSTKLYETSFSCLGYRGLQPSCAGCCGHGTYAKGPCTRQAGVVSINETWAVRKQPRRPYGPSRSEHQHWHMVLTCNANSLSPEQTTVPQHWAAPNGTGMPVSLSAVGLQCMPQLVERLIPNPRKTAKWRLGQSSDITLAAAKRSEQLGTTTIFWIRRE